MKKLFKKIFSYQYSKLIIFFETILVGFTVWRAFELAEYSILLEVSNSLPWITAIVTAVFAAYGVSVAFYYNKSKSEETLKIEKGLGQGKDDATI